MSQRSEPLYTFAPAAVTAVLILAFGAYVVLRRRSTVSTPFFAMTAAVSVWMTAFAVMYSTTDPAAALEWARRGYLGVPFIAPAVYWFVIEILRIEPKRRVPLIAGWAIAAFFSGIAVNTGQLVPRVEKFWFGYYPRYDPVAGGAFLMFFFGYLIAALVELIRLRPDSRGVQRKRIEMLITGFAIACFGCVDYLPKFGIAVYPFGYLAILGFVFVAGRTIRKYDLVPLTRSRAVQETVGTMADALDVTDSFVAETALRESEVRYRLLFEQNAAGVCVSRLDGVIVDCNSTFASMLGEQPTSLMGRRMAELYANPSEEKELAALLRSVGTLNSVEIELRRPDGGALWVLENLALIGEGESAVVHATVVDISDRKRAEDQIEFHAYHDVLTHLPNRKLFTDRLRHALLRARRSGKPVGVMFVDIDHFKSINDTLGHTAGDELLLEMSLRLSRCVREEDTVARLGGDEFTIILAELRHPEDAVGVAQKILDAVHAPLSLGGMPISVTASIGIALYPADGNDPEALLRNSDNAMYRAKESGRNTYQLCTDDMKTRAVERLAVESRLRTALTGDELVLNYQKQVNLVTGRAVGVEALVRWNDPVRGLVQPGSFIPIAEESRLIIPLGEWVLRTACGQMREWQDNGVDLLRVAVNLSLRQFQQHDLVRMIRAILDETGLSPSSLDLEITETTAMQNADATVDVLHGLRELGVGVSIDDFGMGYSSLNYLRRFPITAIKIDRAFMSDLSATPGGAGIVTGVIALGRNLNLRVVAEGVETAEQLDFLRNRECDEAQGFYLAHPVAAADVKW